LPYVVTARFTASGSLHELRKRYAQFVAKYTVQFSLRFTIIRFGKVIGYHRIGAN
jgi:hypothetical protein